MKLKVKNRRDMADFNCRFVFISAVQFKKEGKSCERKGRRASRKPVPQCVLPPLDLPSPGRSWCTQTQRGGYVYCFLFLMKLDRCLQNPAQPSCPSPSQFPWLGLSCLTELQQNGCGTATAASTGRQDGRGPGPLEGDSSSFHIRSHGAWRCMEVHG